MDQRDKFLKAQKVLRLATAGKGNTLHVVPVWYKYRGGEIYIGTNTRTQKVKNLMHSRQVSFCVDVGVNAPDIYGVLGQGTAEIITDRQKTKAIGRQILLRYFAEIKGNRSAEELLADTDCIIKITPTKFIVWDY